MKKEELEATSLVELRIIAKGKGLKNVTALRKAELIDLLLSVEEKEEKWNLRSDGWLWFYSM